jgi:hypothetical protein
MYHGTMHPYAHLVDVLVAHSVAFYYMFNSIKDLLKFRKKLHLIGLFFGGLSTNIYYRKSLPTQDVKQSRRWHMKVHATAQIALVAFILASSNHSTYIQNNHDTNEDENIIEEEVITSSL